MKQRFQEKRDPKVTYSRWRRSDDRERDPGCSLYLPRQLQFKASLSNRRWKRCFCSVIKVRVQYVDVVGA